MALDFDLEINSELSPDDFIKMILKLDEFHEAEFDNGFYSDGVIGGVVSQKDKSGYYADVHQEILRENFGFCSTIKVWFRPDSYENYEIGMRNGLKAFMTVLENDSGNAVILMNGESVRLTRINDEITLDANSFHEEENLIWSLKNIPFTEYKVEKLPNID